MINSMTGYGVRNFTIGKCRFCIEIKSYNHKYLDLSVRLPRAFSHLEADLKNKVSEFAERGKIDILITLTDMPVKDVFNEEKALELYSFLKGLNKKAGIVTPPSLSDLILLREFFINQKEEFNVDGEFEGQLKRQFNECLKSFARSRREEGAFLKLHISQCLKNLNNLVKKVEKHLPLLKEKQKEKIKTRVEELIIKELQRERLEQELAYLYDKLDVSEELSRLNQHIKNFIRILNGKGACGKKLDFYVQEMLREINTLSVKCQDAFVSEMAVEIKGEIEKIREQVQNVE